MNQPALRGVRDPAAAAKAWADDETSRLVSAGDPTRRGAIDFGESYGVAISWGPAPTPHPSGQIVNVPAWFLSLTRPAPVPGGPMLYACDQIGAPEPVEAEVRAKVRTGITAIRALHATQTAAANGQAPQ